MVHTLYPTGNGPDGVQSFLGHSPLLCRRYWNDFVDTRTLSADDLRACCRGLTGCGSSPCIQIMEVIPTARDARAATADPRISAGEARPRLAPSWANDVESLVAPLSACDDLRNDCIPKITSPRPGYARVRGIPQPGHRGTRFGQCSARVQRRGTNSSLVVECQLDVHRDRSGGSVTPDARTRISAYFSQTGGSGAGITPLERTAAAVNLTRVASAPRHYLMWLWPARSTTTGTLLLDRPSV